MRKTADCGLLRVKVRGNWRFLPVPETRLEGISCGDGSPLVRALGHCGLAHKLQATTRGGGLFRIELLPLAPDPDFLCKAAAGVRLSATVMMSIVVLVDRRVHLTAGDKVPVHREGRHERYAQS